MKPHEKLGVAIADAGYAWTPEMRSAWEELDRQQDRIAGLEKRLEENKHTILRLEKYLTEYRDREDNWIYPHEKPLSDEEICELWKQSQDDRAGMSLGFTTQEHYFARAIEERHGIK